ncbi:MAG: hypothetical protein ACLGGX_07830 [Bdellovibrionia bacterium]
MKSIIKSGALSVAGLIMVLVFQNCGPQELETKIDTSDTVENSKDSAKSSSVTSSSSSKIMINTLSSTGEGKPNPYFQKRIKNILVFQVGGWSGLPTEKDVDPDWPLDGGKVGYLSKDMNRLQRQLELIRGLGDSVAISVLLMTDGDSKASGYGTCWNGTWVEGNKCNGGEWRRPLSLYREVKFAAWKKGIMVAPYISLMNYEYKPGTAGDKILPKLIAALNQLRPTFDGTSLKTTDGRWVVMVDSLPEWAGLSTVQKNEIYAYMATQKDILWIDNLVLEYSSAPNVLRSAATFDRSGVIQDALKTQWGNRYLWWFTAGFAKTWAQKIHPDNNIPQPLREKWMNIHPHDSANYPVIISQWNEYAEYLIFEPSVRSKNANYDYLKWMISRQP